MMEENWSIACFCLCSNFCPFGWWKGHTWGTCGNFSPWWMGHCLWWLVEHQWCKCGVQTTGLQEGCFSSAWKCTLWAGEWHHMVWWCAVHWFWGTPVWLPQCWCWDSQLQAFWGCWCYLWVQQWMYMHLGLHFVKDTWFIDCSCTH